MNKNQATLESVLKDRGPELTAYALGELSQEEREALKKEFAGNAEVMSYLQEMEALGGLLNDAVPQKTTHTLLDTQREDVLKARPEKKKFQWWKPQFSVPALSAAAIATICIVMLPKTQEVHEQNFANEVEENPFEDYYKFAGEGDDGDVDGDTTESQEEGSTSASPSTEAPYKYAPAPHASGGSVEKAKAESSTKDPSKSGLFSTMGSQRANKDYSGNGQLAGMADSSTGVSGFAEERTGQGLGFKTKAFGGGKGIGRSQYRKRMAPGYAPSADKDYDTQSEYTPPRGDYLQLIENIFQPVKQEPLSTFSIDVDTASYSQVRTELINSQLPPSGLVRAEEFINYFSYDYPQPKDDKPFSVNVEVTQAPWNLKHHLVRIGLRGRETPNASRAANNFVFLVDVSGSMDVENKLPLVKSSLKMLVNTLRSEDRVAIVTYSGYTTVLLESTSGAQKRKIIDAIDSLTANGSTNGGSAIQLAYKIAIENKLSKGNNRVVLATDGDFNVGMTDENDLEEMIEKKAKSTGVFLTVLGYGMGNYQDSRMQKLANKGNGNNFYIDSLREARKVLVEQGVGTLNAIAKDVKIQVEFHPKHVQSYRLIGYEKRKLNAEDFNDDAKDAGEIGEGHTVTALYEVIPVGVKGGTGTVDPLKYQGNETVVATNNTDELLTVKLRYKKPKEDVSQLIEVPVKNSVTELKNASSDTQFAAAVAGFTMVLRDSKYKGDFTLPKAQELAASHLMVRGKRNDYRAEFVELIKKANSLKKNDSLRKGEAFGE